MKKCNLSIEELKEKILDNLNVSYDEFKEKMMSSFPDELWENCYAISLHRDLYTFLLYKINHLPKSTLQYMQKPDMFEILTYQLYQDYNNINIVVADPNNTYIYRDLIDMFNKYELPYETVKGVDDYAWTSVLQNILNKLREKF